MNASKKLTGIFRIIRMRFFKLPRNGHITFSIWLLSCKSCISLLNKRFRHGRFGRLLILFVLAVASGCARSPAVTFYTLSAMAPMPASPDGVSRSVTVGPVTLPELVDRPQLVIRVSPDRVEVLESHRWAEPLKSGVPRVLAENLGRLLRPALVSTHYQSAGSNAEYRILVDVNRFETVPGEGVTIDALWSVRPAAAGAARKNGHTLATEKAGAGYDALVAAHSRAIATISSDIARAIRSGEGESTVR